MIRPREKLLSHDRLTELLSYNASNGFFTWRIDRGGAKAGDQAGAIFRAKEPHAAYRAIGIDGQRHEAFRLAHFYETGHWPTGAVIPADGNWDNAAIANLRVVPEIAANELRGDLTVELIRKLFFHEGGRLFWAVQVLMSRARYGQEAGSIDAQGYRVIAIGKKPYKASRIAYAHVHGAFPDNEVTHKDGARDNNSASNMKLATHAQNQANGRKSIRPESGITGVHKRNRGRGTYEVHVGGRYHSSHADIGQAIHARREAAKERWGFAV